VLSPPVVSTVTPPTGFSETTTQITISGQNFGPLSNPSLAPIVRVFIGPNECTNVLVKQVDTLISCTVPADIGVEPVIVEVDGVYSNTDVTFTNYGSAGTFSFASASFDASESAAVASIHVVRPNAPFLPPASVYVQVFDATATSPSYFVAANATVTFSEGQTDSAFDVTITAASRIQTGLRKGVVDDRYASLFIAGAASDYGHAAVGLSSAVLNIRAVCQAVTDTCVASIDATGLTYARLDGF